MSEYKQQAAGRRDFRHTHGDPEVAAHRRKRDKGGKECRRSPDGLHSYIEDDNPYGDGRWTSWRTFRCEFCCRQDVSLSWNWIRPAS